jgi:hypothetical protein
MMWDRGRSDGVEARAPARVIALLLGAVTALALYSLLRYGARWGEGDTYAFTRFMDALARAGRQVPAAGAYPHGYGFPAFGVFVSHLGGLALPELQLYAAPLLMIWLVLPAWLLYRELAGSPRGATLATAILLVQPEFLFPLLRGTHEKFTRGLMLVCLYLLLRSLRARQRLPRFAGFVLAFYLSAYALITFNNLIATSFIAAVGLALGLSWAALRYLEAGSAAARATTRRLGYVVLSSLVVAFLFTFYAYPPAQLQLRVLQGIGERLAALFLQVEEVATNPYAVVTGGWVSLPVYFAVSLANWLLLAASAAIWLAQSARWLLRRARPDVSALLLWALYGAFALQAAASIAVDASGAFANLQHRIFPSFAMLAAPLVGRWFAEWRPGRAWVGRLVRSMAGVTVVGLAVLSTLKATNEPLVSNKWLFHLPAEMEAIRWAEGALPGRSLWTAYDERLTTAFGIRTVGRTTELRLDDYQANPGTRDLLISEVTRARSQRLGSPLPVEGDSFLTYDNGQAQIYHLRPRTPFQR